MNNPISVSKAEFERLQQLQQVQEAEKPAGKKSGVDVADDALKFGKKLATVWIISGAVLFLIGAVFILPWMLKGFGQLDQTVQKAQAAQRDPIGTLMPQQYAPVTAESDRALLEGKR